MYEGPVYLYTAFLLESQSLRIMPSSLIPHKCWKHGAERGSEEKKVRALSGQEENRGTGTY